MLQDNTLDQTDPRAEAAGMTVSQHNAFYLFPFTICERLDKAN